MTQDWSWDPPEDEQPPRTGRAASTLLVVLGVVVAAVVGVNALAAADQTVASPGPTPTPTSTWTPAYDVPTPTPDTSLRTLPDCPRPLGGLLLRGVDPRGLATADRDRCVVGSPPRQAVVLRKTGSGTFAHLSAVVTWPLRTGTATPTGLAPQARGPRDELVWPVAGRLARVRGDLPESTLVAIAKATSVSDGWLRVEPPKGLRAAYQGRYSPDTVHELRYPSGSVVLPAELGEAATFSGLQRGADLENALLDGAVRVGAVHGSPAVVYLGEDSALLAWQDGEGVTAYVGLNGLSQTASDSLVRDTLLGLAKKVRTLSAADYAALGASLG